MIEPSLDLIIGPMYSGKSTELFRRLTILAEMGMNVLYINSSLDIRTQKDYSTHNPMVSNLGKIKTQKISKLEDVEYIKFDIIGIDEAQMFPDLEKCVKMVETDSKHVIVSGLSGDFLRRPFSNISELIPKASNITNLYSICELCAQNQKKILKAEFTKRLCKNSELLLVGGKNEYIPVCRKCYLKQ